jgi:IS30 family transposase
MISALRKQGICQAAIARNLERHRSTICRELKRNSARYDGAYRPSIAIERTSGRRSRSRRNSQFRSCDWQRVEQLLRLDWSPEQISGRLRRKRLLSISHETIYRRVRRDRHYGGSLFMHLRCARKKKRKRYGRPDSRGRLSGKRMIDQRPASIEQRARIGHWESDTVMGRSNTHDCILTLLERKSGYVLIGKLAARTKEQTNHRFLRSSPAIHSTFILSPPTMAPSSMAMRTSSASPTSPSTSLSPTIPGSAAATRTSTD